MCSSLAVPTEFPCLMYRVCYFKWFSIKHTTSKKPHFAERDKRNCAVLLIVSSVKLQATSAVSRLRLFEMKPEGVRVWGTAMISSIAGISMHLTQGRNHGFPKSILEKTTRAMTHAQSSSRPIHIQYQSCDRCEECCCKMRRVSATLARNWTIRHRRLDFRPALRVR